METKLESNKTKFGDKWLGKAEKDIRTQCNAKQGISKRRPEMQLMVRIKLLIKASKISMLKQIVQTRA